MFNIGFAELMIIGVVALLVIGPRQLPEVAKVLGRLLGEFKKATEDLSGGLLDATTDVKKAWREAQDKVQAAAAETVKVASEDELRSQARPTSDHHLESISDHSDHNDHSSHTNHPSVHEVDHEEDDGKKNPTG